MDGSSRYVVHDGKDYVAVVVKCRCGCVLTGYGETEAEAAEQLAEKLNESRRRCDQCGLLGLFGS